MQSIIQYGLTQPWHLEQHDAFAFLACQAKPSGQPFSQHAWGKSIASNQFLGLSVYPFIGLSAYRFIGLSVYRLNGLLVYRFLGSSVYRLINLSVCRFIGLSVDRLIGCIWHNICVHVSCPYIRIQIESHFR